MDDLAYRQFLALEERHWWFVGRRRIFFSLLEKALSPRGGLKVLDVGCGFGGMLRHLRTWGDVFGMEIDEGSARFCRDRGFPGICLGSGYELPFRPGSLDLITLFDAIEHIDDDARVLRECARALREGGSLMITVPAYPFLYADNDRIAHHKRRYTLSRLKNLVREAEFEVVKATYFNVILFPLILPAVLLLKARQTLRGPLPPGEEGSTNLSVRYPAPISSFLKGIFSFERHLLTRISSPFGHSIALIARKPRSS